MNNSKRERCHVNLLFQHRTTLSQSSHVDGRQFDRLWPHHSVVHALYYFELICGSLVIIIYLVSYTIECWD